MPHPCGRGWLSSGGSEHRAGPFLSVVPGGSAVRTRAFPGGRAEPLAPGVTPSLSKAVPSPAAPGWRGGVGVLRLPPRGEGATLRRAGTEGRGCAAGAWPGEGAGRVRALFSCMGSQPWQHTFACCCSCPFSHLLVGV